MSGIQFAIAVANEVAYALGGHTGITWGNMEIVYPTVEAYDLNGGSETPSAVSPQTKKDDLGRD